MGRAGGRGLARLPFAYEDCLFPPVGLKGSLSLLEICLFFFSRGLKQMEDGVLRPTAKLFPFSDFSPFLGRPFSWQTTSLDCFVGQCAQKLSGGSKHPCFFFRERVKGVEIHPRKVSGYFGLPHLLGVSSMNLERARAFVLGGWHLAPPKKNRKKLETPNGGTRTIEQLKALGAIDSCLQ